MERKEERERELVARCRRSSTVDAFDLSRIRKGRRERDPLKRITKALAAPPFSRGVYYTYTSANHPQKEKRAEARAGNILDRIGSLNFKISNRVNADIRESHSSIGGGCLERERERESSRPPPLLARFSSPLSEVNSSNEKFAAVRKLHSWCRPPRLAGARANYASV